jgi:hypothetical protein
VQALQDGRLLDLAPGEDLDLTQAAAWPDNRRLPGEALRAALLNPDVRPDPHGLKIRGAYITGPADLAGLQIPCSLYFDSCAFEQSADWSFMTVASLHFTGCAARDLTLVGATIGGQLRLEGSTLTNEGGAALVLDGIDLRGSAFLNPVTVTGEVQAIAATIGGNLRLEGATLTNECGAALVLGSARLDIGHTRPGGCEGKHRLERGPDHGVGHTG